MKRSLLILSIAFALVSCTPKLYDAHIEAPESYHFAGDFSQDSMGMPIAWWEIFGDTTLNTLVEHALENNRNLAIAVSRVIEARAGIAVARAPYLPSLGVNLAASGNYTSPTGIQQQYTVEPSISWDVPLFGTLRSANRAAKAALYASEWGYKGVMLSLAAEVATSYFTLLQYSRDLKIAEQSFILRRESAALVDSLTRYGMSNGVALQQARSLVYQAEADIPQYRRAVEQSRLALCVLLGENPTFLNDVIFDDSIIDDYQTIDIPVGLPSELLERRPDIMEASFGMEQAAAKVGLARSMRFPTISLTGAGGLVSNSLSGIADGHSWAWSAAASIVQPIFSFGKLKRQEQIARENYYQSVFAYEETVLEAFSDVETSLLNISTYRLQAENYGRLLRANIEIATMTGSLYRNGMSPYLDVIDAERSMYQSQMEYVNLVAQQYINYVNLFKSLGGGW